MRRRSLLSGAAATSAVLVLPLTARAGTVAAYQVGGSGSLSIIRMSDGKTVGHGIGPNATAGLVAILNGQSVSAGSYGVGGSGSLSIIRMSDGKTVGHGIGPNATAGLVAILNAHSTSEPVTPTPTPTPAPTAKNRTWLGGYAGDVTAAGQAAFASAYYAPQAIAGYNDWASDWGTVANWFANPPVAYFPSSNSVTHINLITVGLILNIGGSSAMNPTLLQAAANGADVANWTAVAQAVKTRGLDAKNTVLRLGHEANGNWYPWATNNNSTYEGWYRQAWVHAVTAVRAVCPNVRFELCLNAGGGTAAIAGHYAGDAYVDIVGFDFYNFGNATTASGFSNEIGQPGFSDVPAFAHAHSKLFSISEWGLNGNSTSTSQRDVPAFVQWMFAQLEAVDQAYPGIVSHDLYFDQSDNFGLAANPASAAVYRSLWNS